MPPAVNAAFLSATESPTYPIASVDNALRLIETLRDRGAIRLSDASELIGCGRSTAHRLLAMLKHHGFAKQDPDTRLYLVGDGLLRLDRGPAEVFVAGLAQPILRAVSRATEQSAHLCELRGGSVFFLESVAGNGSTATGSRRGVAYPAHCVSAGKALLAQLPRDSVRSLVGHGPLDRLTSASIGSVEALERNLRLVRERGYAVNAGESQQGVTAVAVALPPTPTIPPVALSVAAPMRHMTAERVEKAAATLRRATLMLATRLDDMIFYRDAAPRLTNGDGTAGPRPRAELAHGRN
jgi:DNA-binding IclR family transcriptional regulator